MTKAGRLFEVALKDAGIDLKSGVSFNVLVKEQRDHLRLVVSAIHVSEFEADILARAKKGPGVKAAYQPDLPVGERVRALRKGAGLTLDALATKANMSKGSLCSIEKGERPAGLAILKRLAKSLGVSVATLVQ